MIKRKTGTGVVARFVAAAKFIRDLSLSLKLRLDRIFRRFRGCLFLESFQNLVVGISLRGIEPGAFYHVNEFIHG